jgi:peptidoglycan/LPS O-acetylase OafA/YrhL
LNYIKQLDTLRIFAVVGVILSHWVVGPKLVDPNSILARFPLGSMVDFFFVLSGFLITSILLSNKESIEKSGKTNKDILMAFYFKRAIRILPIYYLYIIISVYFFPFSIPNFDNSKWYYITHTINFYYYIINAWEGINGHFWSLSVEEQFYLVWPFVILFTPRKYLLQIIISFILIGSISQFYFNDSSRFFNKLPITCLDCFGLGGLLAYFKKYNNKDSPLVQKILSLAAIFSFVILFVSISYSLPFIIPRRTLAGIVSMSLVFFVVQNQYSNNFIYKKVLGNPILTYLGKISYGIYIYHIIIPYTNAAKYLNKIWMLITPATLNQVTNANPAKWTLFLNGLVLLTISIISYHLIEKQILKLKSKV